VGGKNGLDVKKLLTQHLLLWYHQLWSKRPQIERKRTMADEILFNSILVILAVPLYWRQIVARIGRLR
jgi:hypothetical protein